MVDYQRILDKMYPWEDGYKELKSLIQKFNKYENDSVSEIGRIQNHIQYIKDHINSIDDEISELESDKRNLITQMNEYYEEIKLHYSEKSQIEEKLKTFDPNPEYVPPGLRSLPEDQSKLDLVKIKFEVRK